MTGMFEYCSKLKSLDFSNFNTDNVRTMDFMFISCSSLTSLNLYKFKTENVTDMDSMFYRCSELTYINLSNFNTLNVTNMETMFGSCGKLETIVVGSTFTTGSVTASDDMFKQCTSLVGANGTRCDGINHINKEYARIDGVEPGYFTGIRLETISINSNPDITSYFVGQSIDPTGLKINLNYSDGAVVVVEYTSGNAGDFAFDPSLSASLSVMNKSVKVTYSGKSTLFGIRVSQRGGGNSGGSGESGGGPTLAEVVPNTTSVSMIKIIKGNLSSLTSKWELYPSDGGWGLNIIDASGNEIPVTDGFYTLTYVNTQIINGVPIQTESNSTYFFNENGRMVTGWIRTSDGKCYFLKMKRPTPKVRW